MAEKSSLGVTGVACCLDKLMDDVPVEGIPVLFWPETACILGVERKGHIQAIEPDLMRVYLLVPEFSASGARLGIELFADLPEHTAVFLVACHEIQVEIYPCRADMVQVVVLFLVAVDLAFVRSHGVGPVLDIIHHIREIVSVGHIKERFEFQACGIVPFEFSLPPV